MTSDDNERRTAANTLRGAQQITEETAQKLIGLIEKSAPVRHLRASQVVSGVLGALGLVLVVFGVERATEDIPVLSNPYGSIAVGLLLLAATGLLLRKLMDKD